ncbi:MAG: hypothetical protein CR972_01940 [Candidatus Moraniibacteriota bacterium]|nr:MAG: hypothetical protein CR972_01940 [Candidatus Moranbacteria bacterium]
MKNILKYIGVGIIIFIIGGLGGLLMDYMIFSKVITHPVWSEYPLIKALDNRVKVIKNTEKIVVENNESIADIANRASTTVTYVEVVRANGERVSGNGIVISSDGVVATTIGDIDETDAVHIKLSDNSIYTVSSFFNDSYTGITFLKINATDLATISFANSDEARSGKQLIGIMQSRMKNGAYFASGGLIGNAYNKSIMSPISDHLQGTLKIDLSESVFEMSVGAPVVDYHGNMIGLIAKKNVTDMISGVVVDTEYYAIAANDVYKAFEDYLHNENDEKAQQHLLLGVDYEMISSMDVYIDQLTVDSGAKIIGPKADATYQQKTLFNNTLAARSGLLGGDIVVMVDTSVVDVKHNLSRLMHDARGKNVTLKVMRNGELVSIDIRLSK